MQENSPARAAPDRRRTRSISLLHVYHCGRPASRSGPFPGIGVAAGGGVRYNDFILKQTRKGGSPAPGHRLFIEGRTVMSPTKSLTEREKELQAMLTTTVGRAQLRDLKDQYET